MLVTALPVAVQSAYTMGLLEPYGVRKGAFLPTRRMQAIFSLKMASASVPRGSPTVFQLVVVTDSIGATGTVAVRGTAVCAGHTALGDADTPLMLTLRSVSGDATADRSSFPSSSSRTPQKLLCASSPLEIEFIICFRRGQPYVDCLLGRLSRPAVILCTVCRRAELRARFPGTLIGTSIRTHVLYLYLDMEASWFVIAPGGAFPVCHRTGDHRTNFHLSRRVRIRDSLTDEIPYC